MRHIMLTAMQASGYLYQICARFGQSQTCAAVFYLPKHLSRSPGNCSGTHAGFPRDGGGKPLRNSLRWRTPPTALSL